MIYFTNTEKKYINEILNYDNYTYIICLYDYPIS